MNLKKKIGQMLEPAWLYADLGDDLGKNPLEVLTETVEKYNCRSAVVHLGDVTEIRRLGCKKIIAVADFPYGRGGIWGKRIEAIWTDNSDGAIGLDVVINLWALQKKDWKTIKDELLTVKKYCPEKEIKVICQMPFIWQYHRDLIRPLLYVLADCDIKAVKDWTTINNFSKPIKTDVETRIKYITCLRILINENELPLLIKVAGGVNGENVVSFKAAGADIFGVGCQKVPAVFEALTKYLKKK